MNCADEYLRPGLGQAQKYGRVKHVNKFMGSLLIIGSSTVIQIQTNNIQLAHIHFQSKLPHTVAKYNYDINMDSTFKSRISDCSFLLTTSLEG
jgi:hypothetical protein